MKKIKLDKRSVRNIGLIVLLSALVALTPKAVKKIKEEKRAHEFYEYIMDEVDKYVEENVDSYDIEKFKELYAENPELKDLYLQELLKSVDKYAKSIVEGAHLINKFDKTVSFAEAMKLLEKDGYAFVSNTEILADRKARAAAQIKAKNLYEKEKVKR